MKTKFFLFLFFAFVLKSAFTEAQWVKTGGPAGGGVGHCLARVGNKIWAGCSDGIYTSDNEGATWIKHPLFNNSCLDLKSYNDTVVVLYLTIESGAQSSSQVKEFSTVSFDNGMTWSTPVFIESPPTSSYSKLYRSGNSLIKTSLWDFYISNDFGISWSILPIPNGDYMYVKACDDKSFVAEIDNSTTGEKGIYLTSNGGQTWNFIDSTYDVMTAIIQDSILIMNVSYYDTTWNYLLVRSDDFGNSWDTTYVFQPGTSGGGLSYFNGNFYCNLYPDHLISSDGITWNTVSLPPDYSINSYYGILLLSNGDYLSCLGNKIIRFVPTQNIFYQTETGIASQYILTLNAHNGVLYTSTTQGTFRSDNGGITWTTLPYSMTAFDAIFKGDTIVFANEEYYGYIVRSLDNGNTWDSLPAPTGSNWANPTSLEEFNGRLYLSGDSISYSDDVGQTWNLLNFTSDSIPGNCIGTSIVNGSLHKLDTSLYIITNDGIVARYDVPNQKWNFVYCFWSTGADNDNKLYKLDNVIAIVGRPGFFISNDQGLNWTYPLLNGLPLDYNGDSFIPRNIISAGGVWFGTCGSEGVYYSTDQGDNWQAVHTGAVPFYATGGLTLLNSILYSGSYNYSVWKKEGPINFITGTVYKDDNNNGVKDGGETGMSQVIVKTTPATVVTCTDASGNYSIYSNGSGDTLSVVKPVFFSSVNPQWYLTDSVITNRDFGIYIPPGIYDLSVDLTNANVFRPGFQSTIGLTTLNKGSYVQPAEVKLILDPQLQFISATDPPDIQSGDTLTWFTDTLQFLDSRYISVTVETSVNASIGDSILCSAVVYPVIPDTMPQDNYADLSAMIVGSFDPNDKQCLQGEYFTPDQLQDNEELEYIVRFQNTGTFPATTVHVTDTLSSLLDISTFRIVSSSHLMHWTLSESGIADFYFDNINLPPSVTDELHSHGFVKYAIRCRHEVIIGNAIANTAHIYFDFNQPVATNETTTLIAYPVILYEDKPTNQPMDAFAIYPNPSSGHLNIDVREIKADNLEVLFYDMTGHMILKEKLLQNSIHESTISNLSDGLYFGIIESDGKKIGDFRFILKNE